MVPMSCELNIEAMVLSPWLAMCCARCSGATFPLHWHLKQLVICQTVDRRLTVC